MPDNMQFHILADCGISVDVNILVLHWALINAFAAESYALRVCLSSCFVLITGENLGKLHG